MSSESWLKNEQPDWRDYGIALLVVAAVFFVLMNTMQMGFTRDESFYFHAAFQYIRWFEGLADNYAAGTLSESFTRASIDKHWAYNAEHPVLMKTLFALSYKLFHQKLEWLSASSAMRLPGAATGALVCGIVYLWSRELFGRAAGVLAVAALILQPHVFFHAHMACFDMPVVFVWVAVVYAYWRSWQSRGWAVACGVLWGIALSTKLNAFFLPLVLLAHWGLARFREFRITREGGLRLHVPGVPWAFFAMLIIGPILFYALWPRHWFDTTNRVEWYLNFHLKHVHYFVYYFGKNIQQPPLPVAYPWVMTLVTVPATILASFVLGVVAWWVEVARKTGDSRRTGLLLAINILFPIALISMPETPIFGGTKHWMTAMPFLAIVAAGGITWAIHRLDMSGARRAIALAVVATLAFAPAAWGVVSIHPFGTSYYNELIGSTRGAADRQMMRQFWGYTSRQAMPWLNENAPKRARIWTHNTTGYAWGVYKRDGLLRKDLNATQMKSSDFALYHHQKAFVFKRIKLWSEYGTRAPAYVVDVDGVPVMSVYRRPHLDESSPR